MAEYSYAREQLGRKSISIQLGSKRYFPDIAAYHKDLSHERDNVNLVVEIEPDNIEPTDANHGTGQVESYLRMLPNCRYGIWYNGIQQINLYKESPTLEPVEINDIPPYGLEIGDIERPDFGQLRPASELRSIFKRCHNFIAGIEGLRKEEAFNELLKIIFCKVLDERLSTHVQFYVTNRERKENPERCKSRIDTLFEQVKNVHKDIFEKDAIIKLDAQVVAYLVSQLQSFTLIGTDTDVKGEAYEEIVGGNLRGDRGEYFTPRTVCNAAVEMLFHTFPEEQWEDLSIIDPACGTGGFLIAVINFLKARFYELEFGKWKDSEKARVQTAERIKSYCERNLHGIDINPTLARASQMNEVMHGNGHGNVFPSNSLRQPSVWKKIGRPVVELGKFSILLTNPPFGSKIPVTDPDVLRQFDLGHI
jgi:type I restriction enzyme M protein